MKIKTCFISAILLSLLIPSFELLCSLCHSSVSLATYFAEALIPTSILIEAASILCDRQYESEKVCNHVSQGITPIAIHSVLSGYFLNKAVICQFFCHNYQTFDVQEQSQRILEGRPINQKIKPLHYKVDKTQINLGNSSNQVPVIRLLQISDVHLDLNYTIDSSMVCEFPICCHGSNGFPKSTDQKAPKYGSVKCDTPDSLLQSGLDFIEELGGVDITIVTGDYSAHNEWEKTVFTLKQIPQIINRQLQKSSKSQILIQNMGNNDYLPDHQVPESEQQLIHVYQIGIRGSNNQKLTFISLNTVVCDNLNLNLILSQETAIRQLSTLQRVLETHENIYILGHIAPTSQSCSPKYKQIFRALVKKYSLKIKGQFYGHSHIDEFLPFTNPNGKQEVVGFGFGIGSFSPLFVGSSRFRIYEIVPQGIVDYTDYIMNNFTHPNWAVNYKFRQYYGFKPSNNQHLTLNQLALFRKKLVFEKDRQLLRRYYDKSKETASQQKYFECKMVDDQQERSSCSQNTNGFKMKIVSVLRTFQGRWGFTY